MKAILEFDLPEDDAEMERCLRSSSLIGCLTEFDNYLRHRLKYEELSNIEDKVLQQARTKLWELIEDHEVGRLL